MLEAVGGVLMMPAATRRVGGVLVASASAVMLASEVQHGDARLAAPRGLVLLAGLAALFAARRRGQGPVGARAVAMAVGLL